MAISPKDQKILWAKAAGLCSFRECQVRLTMEKGGGDSLTLGEMAHIVGEKETSPRGTSQLSSEDRDRYPNRILLCRHHHEIIDKDVDSYPVELLHQIKTDHELWVENRLFEVPEDPENLIYTNCVNTITTALRLEVWFWFTDHAIRELIHESFIDARGVLNDLLARTLWPNRELAFENSVRDLIESYSEFITHYEENAAIRDAGEFYSPIRTHTATCPNPNYYRDLRAFNYWADKHCLLLHKFVFYLNIYAEEVRTAFNPMYFRIEGRFLIYDTLGFRHDGNNTIEDVGDDLSVINSALEDLESRYRDGDAIK